MKVCIVSASGKLGRHMVRQALDRGLVRTTHGGQHTGFQPKLGAPTEGGRFASGICAGWLRTDGRLARRTWQANIAICSVFMQPARAWDRASGIKTGSARNRRSSTSALTTKDADLQDVFTGATGLEPATSGVTGRHSATGYSRLRPGITG
jgi:hypothetical protein